MTILVELKAKPFTIQREEFVVRTEACMQAINQYIRGYFEPQSIEIWYDAPISELGGTLASKTDINVGSVSEIRSILNDKIKRIEQSKLFETIIRVYGIWKLNRTEQRGFFSINNSQRWRAAYGDIDMDVISGKEQDITKLMWEDEDRKILVNDFFQNFLEEYRKNGLDKKMTIIWICFASNIPSGQDITEMKATYYHDLKQFIKDSFETYKQNTESVQKSLRLQYIVDLVNSNREFRKRMKQKLETFRINEIEGNSIVLIAEEPNSFQRLYEDLSKEFFVKIFNGLQTDSDVNSKVNRVIRGDSDISDFA